MSARELLSVRLAARAAPVSFADLVAYSIVQRLSSRALQVMVSEVGKLLWASLIELQDHTSSIVRSPKTMSLSVAAIEMSSMILTGNVQLIPEVPLPSCERSFVADQSSGCSRLHSWSSNVLCSNSLLFHQTIMP